MIRMGLFLETLTAGTPGYSKLPLSQNFYVPENIISPAWIHLLIPSPNNKAMDTGNHSNGRKGNLKTAKLSINFSTCLLQIPYDRGEGRKHKLHI